MSATDNEVVQLQLVPDEPLELSSDTMLTEMLAHEEVQAPTKQLIDSIKRFGLLQPILVRCTEGNKGPIYNVVDGRRRLAVARILKLDTIPVLIAETDLAIADVATLATNATRTNNPVAEFKAIKRLVERGASEKDIAGATGMPRQTIKARQSLLRLTPSLMEAFEEGKMTATVASDAAKLPVVLQNELATLVLTEGKITERNIHDIRTAQAQRAMATMPEGFDFGEEVDECKDEETPDASVEYGLAQELQSIIERMPKEQGVLIRSLQWVASMLVDLSMGMQLDPSLMVPPESDAAFARAVSEQADEREPDDEVLPDDQSDMPMPWELAEDER